MRSNLSNLPPGCTDRDIEIAAGAYDEEDQIERRAERKMDALDACLMSGALSQEEYDAAVKRLYDWAQKCLSAFDARSAS